MFKIKNEIERKLEEIREKNEFVGVVAWTIYGLSYATLILLIPIAIIYILPPLLSSIILFILSLITVLVLLGVFGLYDK